MLEDGSVSALNTVVYKAEIDFIHPDLLTGLVQILLTRRLCVTSELFKIVCILWLIFTHI